MEYRNGLYEYQDRYRANLERSAKCALYPPEPPAPTTISTMLSRSRTAMGCGIKGTISPPKARCNVGRQARRGSHNYKPYLALMFIRRVTSPNYWRCDQLAR